ncbi:hypothetical protein [Herbiconiux sp.]|uniref:hypothetical protein n=1 Tax=Herbiconiux sp. TaxID=1871186 RepID=UPI0025C47C77|nr:hypothetical protein [Herbiconiux sp.]
MVAQSISVHGNGNNVAGRDVNIASTTFSIEQVPEAFRREFLSLQEYVKSSDSVKSKRDRVRKFAQDMTVSGFGAAAGATLTYLLALI